MAKPKPAAKEEKKVKEEKKDIAKSASEKASSAEAKANNKKKGMTVIFLIQNYGMSLLWEINFCAD